MKSIEEQIRRAMEEGKFEDLPGKGRPLDMQENPYEDPQWSMAYRMLRSGGFTLPWIESRKEIGDPVAEARANLARAWEWRQVALSDGESPALIDDEWRRALAAFQNRVDEINIKIAAYNLEVPTSSLQLPPLSAEKEIAAITGAEM